MSQKNVADMNAVLLQAAVGQTEDIFRVLDVAGNVIGRIPAQGSLVFPGEEVMEIAGGIRNVGGSGQKITIAENAAMDPGLYGFTIGVKSISLNDKTSSILIDNVGSNNGYKLEIDANDKLKISVGDGTNMITATADDPLDTRNGYPCDLFAVVQRLITRGEVTFYENGQKVGATKELAGLADTETVQAGGPLNLMDAAEGQWQGKQPLLWNRALTAAEIVALYVTGKIATADRWASETGVGGNANDDTADDDTGNWTLVGCTMAFDTDHYEVTGSADPSTVTVALSGATIGQRYRFQVQIKDGTDDQIEVTLKHLANDDTVLTTGAVVRTNATFRTAFVEFIATETNNKVQLSFAAITATQNIEIKTMENIPIGVMIMMNLASGWPQFHDDANGYHALASATGIADINDVREHWLYGSNTWAAAHDIQSMLAAQELLTSAEEYLDFWAKASTGTPEIDIGDEIDKDEFVDGQALSTVWAKCTAASIVSDGTNLELKMEVSADGGWDADPSENFTGTISWAVKISKLDI